LPQPPPRPGAGRAGVRGVTGLGRQVQPRVIGHAIHLGQSQGVQSHNSSVHSRAHFWQQYTFPPNLNPLSPSTEHGHPDRSHFIGVSSSRRPFHTTWVYPIIGPSHSGESGPRRSLCWREQNGPRKIAMQSHNLRSRRSANGEQHDAGRFDCATCLTPRTRAPCPATANPHRLRGDHNSWGTPCHLSRARCCPTTA
jgi:hypothetical protein